MANAALAIVDVERINVAALEAELEAADRLELERTDVLEFIMKAYADENSNEDFIDRYPTTITVAYYDFFKAHRAAVNSLIDEGILVEGFANGVFNHRITVTKAGMNYCRRYGIAADPKDWPEC